MTKGFHKKTSKRMPLKRRYKIEKRVKQHNKKIKKIAKKEKDSRKARMEAKRKEKELEAMKAAASKKPNKPKPKMVTTAPME